MAAIPTILKGDDSGSIVLTLETGRSYSGATLVIAYQGVTRQFTDLTAGQSVTFSFTHDETSSFDVGTYPMLMRLVGQYGAEETVENAEARIKTTDCLEEVNAGGTFIIKPGEQGASGKVPITDVGDVATRYTLADLQEKVNEIVHVLAQRSLLAAAVLLSYACCLPLHADTTNAWTASLGDLYNDSLVYTNIPEWAQDPNPPVSMTDNAVVYTNGVLKTKVGDTVPVASTGEVAQIYRTVMSWEGFLDGSNVVFSITNYISGSYNLNAAKLRILELTNGVYREVYNSRDEIALHMTDFKTNEFLSATNEIATAVDAKIADKAPRAWGKYSSAGTDINALGITNAVYLTEPTTYFAGGTEWWSTSVGEGTVCVLAAKGAAALAANEEGTFCFRDLTTTNYFGFTTRDNFIIGCDADRFHTEKSGRNTMMVIEYDLYNGASYPIVLYRPTLENFASNSWVQLNDSEGEPVAGAPFSVAWTNDVDTYTAFINCGTNAAGFFMAETMVNGEVEFSTNMKADFKGGIVTTDGEHIIKPVYASGELTWRTFDYGSGIQVSTPSSSQVRSTAKQMSYVAVKTALTTDEGEKANIYDFQNGTNFTLQIYVALTNIIKTLGGSVTNAPSFD